MPEVLLDVDDGVTLSFPYVLFDHSTADILDYFIFIKQTLFIFIDYYSIFNI